MNNSLTPPLIPGSGKSSLCQQFKAAGFSVFDEAFIQQPHYTIHPQSLTMETLWVANWFQRLLKTQHETENPNKIFIADRSPYSAVFYAKEGGHHLEPLIRQQIEELRVQAGIEVYTVNIKVHGFQTLCGRCG